jgi:hypothetical protein
MKFNTLFFRTPTFCTTFGGMIHSFAFFNIFGGERNSKDVKQTKLVCRIDVLLCL